jgi:hypothetical protein
MGDVMAATYPDPYDAFASAAGCSYLCSDPTGDVAYTRMGAYARVMPTVVFTGTTDNVTIAPMGELTVSQWLGTNDRADDGPHNFSATPVCTTSRATRAPSGQQGGAVPLHSAHVSRQRRPHGGGGVAHPRRPAQLLGRG